MDRVDLTHHLNMAPSNYYRKQIHPEAVQLTYKCLRLLSFGKTRDARIDALMFIIARLILTTIPDVMIGLAAGYVQCDFWFILYFDIKLTSIPLCA